MTFSVDGVTVEGFLSPLGHYFVHGGEADENPTPVWKA